MSIWAGPASIFTLGFIPPGGADAFSGGAGFDAVQYEDAGSVKIDLGAGVVSGAPGRKTIHSIEWAAGSIGNDTLIGTRGDNFLRGFSGNDRVEARGGDDTLVGDSGTDTLDGGAGTDRCLLGETVSSCEAEERRALRNDWARQTALTRLLGN
ncbi:MAG: hypothetical protein ACRDLZ_05405 [Gaiellaceae bacterium]